MPRIPLWIFALIALLYFSAIKVDMMDIDATQYAEISREMASSKDFLHIYDRGNNYLDKPPFLFWISALGIQLFGATNLGFKLPSILMALLAIYATYRFARLWYAENTARVAALVLATCQGMFLMTNDIRCDLVLMSWVITAIWCLQEWLLAKKKFYFLLAAALALACGLMTKGPIALIVPIAAFSVHFILKRQWSNFFRLEYLFLLALIAVFLIPMCWGLYEQYDAIPLKFVDGKIGVSGLKFFFWTQSFGRITGENVWDNGADLSFQLVNMLWSFLPWIFILLPALVIKVRQLFQQKFKLAPQEEWVSTGGFILTYFAVGLSHYQLPHYIFVAFPLAAIVVASCLEMLYDKAQFQGLKNVLEKVISISGILLLVGVLLILSIVFPAPWYVYAALVLAMSIYFYLFLKKHLAARIIYLGFSAIFLVNIFLSQYFYPQLLNYQVGTVMGKYIKAQGIPANKIIAYKMTDPLNSLHYYAQQVIRVIRNTGYLPSQEGDYILTSDEGRKELIERAYQLELVKEGQLFKVSELNATFLNAQKRKDATQAYYFFKIIKVGQNLAQ